VSDLSPILLNFFAFAGDSIVSTPHVEEEAITMQAADIRTHASTDRTQLGIHDCTLGIRVTNTRMPLSKLSEDSS